MELKSFNPPKSTILSIEESSSRLRLEINNAFKPAREVLKKFNEYCKNMGSELSHTIEESKKAHTAAFHYFGLYLDKDPNFLIEIRKHTKAVAKKKGFADCYITPGGLLHSYSLQDLPEEALAEVLFELGDQTLGDFEKVPLRVWDKVTTYRGKKKEERKLVSTVEDIESVAVSIPTEDCADFWLNEMYDDALAYARRQLLGKQKEYADLMYRGNTDAEAARILDISRVAAGKRRRTVIKKLASGVEQYLDTNKHYF